MYVPDHFKVPDVAELHRLIAAKPFGTLVINGPLGLDANHVPFELDAGSGGLGILRAHVARANSMWSDVDNGAEVMVVFRVTDAYVSPNWYPSKHEFHRQVPTWNYEVVHAHGTVTIRDDERYVRGLVARLTRTHEAGQPAPWKMSDSQPAYIDELLAAIVGVEIEITRLVGKQKLSQNKASRDRRGAGEALVQQGHTELGHAMLESIPDDAS